MKHRFLWRSLGLIAVLLVVLSASLPMSAATDLPASAWYAVVWNPQTDTLHWVNSVGEQASQPRPKLPNEGQQGISMNISPNGRYMLLHGPLLSGRMGLGFYDFAVGDFIQVHESQPNEMIIAAERNPFTLNSEYVAIGLSDTESPNWRVIAFETATGDVVGQLTSADPAVAGIEIPPATAPKVAFYDLEQNFGQWRVQVRFVTLGPNPGLTNFPALAWIPESGSVSANSLHPNMNGFDVLPQQSRVIYTIPDANAPDTSSRLDMSFVGSYDSAETIYNTPNAFAFSPRWVANGLMVAFRVAQQPYATMWHLMPALGGESTPFGPDYDELLGTVDGFIIADYEGRTMRYSNTLQFEAFTPSVGNLIYSTDTSAFQVIYVTPMGADFTLATLAGPGVPLVGGVDVQIPACGGAPAPRLTVGGDARVTVTNGTPLNVRTAPGGDMLMQIPEGLEVGVIAGPECADNLYWWNIQFENNNVTVGGWAAEGDSNGYFLEPLAPGDVAPIPTSTPGIVVQPPVIPTSTPQLGIQQPGATQPPVVLTPLGLAPTNTPAIIVQVDCLQSPPTQLQVGMKARTINPGGGTLAMRINITDPFPTYQIPAMQDLDIVGGPQCREGIRMWQVTTNLNGQSVTGWLAEGFGQVYYIVPL